MHSNVCTTLLSGRLTLVKFVCTRLPYIVLCPWPFPRDFSLFIFYTTSHNLLSLQCSLSTLLHTYILTYTYIHTQNGTLMHFSFNCFHPLFLPPSVFFHILISVLESTIPPLPTFSHVHLTNPLGLPCQVLKTKIQLLSPHSVTSRATVLHYILHLLFLPSGESSGTAVRPGKYPFGSGAVRTLRTTKRMP